MIRVVHVFNVKNNVEEAGFVEWLDAKLNEATRRYGCVDRRTWVLLDGFEGSYARPTPVRNRPKYVIEAYWEDQRSADGFRKWLMETKEGRELHERWFNSVTDHSTLRYVEGLIPVMADETVSDHDSLMRVIKADAADYVKFGIKQAGGL